MNKIRHHSYTVIETVEGLVHRTWSGRGRPSLAWKKKEKKNYFNYTERMTSIRNLDIFPLGRNVAMISYRKHMERRLCGEGQCKEQTPDGCN